MQDTAHAAGTPTAHQGGPLRDPLEQAPPRSRMRAPSGGLRPVRGAVLPSSRFSLARGLTPPRAGFRLARGCVPPSAGVRHARGRPSRMRRPPVHGHLTP
jgi:hypothetical protein